MGSLYEQFETNANFEKDGINLEYGDGVKFRVARAGGQNQAYSKALEKAIRPHRVALANDTLDAGVAEKVLLDVFCSTVLLGWEGVKDRAGVVMPFTKENAIKLMTDLPDLYADIRAQANKVSNFRKEQLETDLKN